MRTETTTRRSNEPSDKQKLALSYLSDTETSFVGYGGAAFGGKTYLLCTWIVAMALRFPGTYWGIGRKVLVTLKKTTLETLFKVFTEIGLVDKVHYRYNSTLSTLSFYNGSKLFFIEMRYRPEDPLFQRFQGYELTGAAVDESAEVPIKAITTLFTRLGRRLNYEYKIRPKLLETFNPAKTHVYGRYYKPDNLGKLPKSYKFVKALPKDNPSPNVEEYISQLLEGADKVTKERLIYGNFEYDDDPLSLCDYDKIQDLFSNDYVEEGIDRYLTADIAGQGSDKFVLIVWAGFKAVYYEEIGKSTGKEVVDKIKDIRKRFRIPNSNIIYDADGIGSGVDGFFPGSISFHTNARPFPDPLSDSRDPENYENLKTQLAYALAKRVNSGSVFLAFEPDETVREEIVEELEQLKRRDIDKEGPLKIARKETIKEKIGRSPDRLDALILRLYFEYNVSKGRSSQFKPVQNGQRNGSRETRARSPRLSSRGV
jgi:phage terminase large subunit